jgi:hypothetical protein
VGYCATDAEGFVARKVAPMVVGAVL